MIDRRSVQDWTEPDFWSHFGRIEHERLDFKKGPDWLKDIIPAMAMTEGGDVILGITDQREIVGCPLSQNTLDVAKRAGHRVGVEIELREIRVDSVPLTVVTVPEVTGRIVTTTDGRLLHRVGSECQPLVGDALARFVIERDSTPAEQLPTTGSLDVNEYDVSLVNEALRNAGRPAVKRNSVLRGLRDLDLTVRSGGDETVMVAAPLLFSKDPSSHLSGAVVQVVRRVGVEPGPGPATLREQVKGPVPHVLDRVLDLVQANTDRFQVVVGSRREVLTQYPAPVLREALLNALAHRDYGLQGATVDVTIFDDRLEIRSPGPLPGHITLENMRDEHYSRNRRMMRVLKLLNLVEEYGEGVDRMYSEMEARLMEPPNFAVTSASVTVTLYNRFMVSVEDQAWLALLGQFNLSPAERRLLVVARHEGGVTPRRLREVVPAQNARPLLQGAVAKGLLVRTGTAGGSRYLLSDEVVLRAGASGLEARSRQRQILLDEVRRVGSISTAEGAELLDEDMAVVRHLLNDLARSGAVEARGRTRGRRYFVT